MNFDPNGTDALFEIIRKELNTIIEHGEKKTEDEFTKRKGKVVENRSIPENDVLNQNRTNPDRKDKEKEELAFEKVKKAAETLAVPGIDTSESENQHELRSMHSKLQSSLETDTAHQTAFLNSPRTKNIDADLQRMQIELQDSYNLFQGISEKFDNINFQNLHKRIKELNLSNKRDILGSARTDELKEVVEEGFRTNRMKELTAKVGERFNKHHGEFGNIPELSTFFQACTQLEHVLRNLKRQHNDARDLEERMRLSAEISYNRIGHIQEQLKEMKLRNPIAMEDFNDI